MRLLFAALVLVLAPALSACGKPPPAEATVAPDAGAEEAPDASTPAPDAGAPTACRAYGTPKQVGTVTSAELPELSGIAESTKRPGVFFVHNDSGDTARFFAIDLTGALLAQFTLPTASATDWEDIDVGPCPSGSCVFLGDIGDNAEKRAGYVVYRVAEPDVGAPEASPKPVLFEALRFVYPDGPHNAETLLVHPKTGEVYVVTKRPGAATVYRFPVLDPAQTVTLVKVTDISLGSGSQDVLTAGSFHPSGDRILLRGYFSALEWRGQPGESVVEIFGHTAVVAPLANETQGEAIAYRRDGLGYVTGSEGKDQPLFEIRCR